MAQPKAPKTAGKAATKAVTNEGALEEARVGKALKKRWKGARGRYRSALANESVG